MASIASIWPTAALPDKIAGAVYHVLASDAQLQQWAGARIYKMVALDPAACPEVPDIQVAAVSTADEFQPSSVIEQRNSVAIQIRWQVYYKKAQPADPTEATVIEHVKRLLLGNSCLQGTPIEAGNLAYRLEGPQPVSYETIETGNGYIGAIVLRADWYSEVLQP